MFIIWLDWRAFIGAEALLDCSKKGRCVKIRRPSDATQGSGRLLQEKSPGVSCNSKSSSGGRLCLDRHADVFEFCVILDSMARAFATKAGALDAAERSDLRRYKAGVRTDHTCFQCFRHTPKT